MLSRAAIPLWAAIALTVPGVVLGATGTHIAPPVDAVLFGIAVIGAAFVLSWVAEAIQIDISPGLAISLLALIVGIDASAAFLQRRSLVALADASALAGAQGIDLDSYYRQGASGATSLDEGSVAARVTGFVAQADAIEGLRLERVVTDGRSVTVRLSAPLRLPFLSAIDPSHRIADPVMVEARALLAYRVHGEPG